MYRRYRLLLVTLLGMGYILALFVAPLSLTVFSIIAAGLLVLEYLFLTRDRMWIPNSIQKVFGDSFRVLALEFIIAFSVISSFSTKKALAIVSLVALTALARSFKVRLSQISFHLYETKVAWRNLSVNKPIIPFARNFLTISHTREIIVEAFIILLASFVSGLTRQLVVLEAILILIILIRACVGAYLGLVLLNNENHGRLAATQEAIKKALAEHAPEVLMYMAGPMETVNTVNVWTPTLDSIKQRCLIIVRERWHLEKVLTNRTPILYIPKYAQLQEYLPDSIKIALYPVNSMNNLDVINLPHIIDVFVGHGDSDKSASANPMCKIYDEIWVAGPAAVDRYIKSESGIDPTRIKRVGRPQLVDIRHASEVTAADRSYFTVLYAPTWEGAYAEASYSSLAMGKKMLKTLLTIPGVRILYKPHPSTGIRDPLWEEHDQSIRHLIKHAGKPHQVVKDLGGLYEAFNRADLLITDISSVITDFLYSHKAYIVTNPNNVPVEAFYEEFPSAAGAQLLNPDLKGLKSMVLDAMTTDTMKLKRVTVANYLLGASRKNPVKKFQKRIKKTARGGKNNVMSVPNTQGHPEYR